MTAERASAASLALASGNTNAWPSRHAWRAIGNAPRIGRSVPVSASSPANSWLASGEVGNCSVAARMPSAMGRSKRPDSFGRSAGARFTVILRAGKSNSLDEGLYVESAREMRLSGDFVTPRVNGEPFFEKPPLVYWLAAGCFAVF